MECPDINWAHHALVKAARIENLKAKSWEEVHRMAARMAIRGAATDKQLRTYWASPEGAQLFTHENTWLETDPQIIYDLMDMGIPDVMHVFKQFIKVKRRFFNMHILYRQTVSCFKTKTYLSSIVLKTLAAMLHQSTCFDAQSNIEWNGRLLTDLVITAGGAESFMNHLEMFEKAGRTFTDTEDLKTAIFEAVARGIHVDKPTRTAVTDFIFAPANGVFSSDVSHVRVQGRDLDEIVFWGKGQAGVIRKLKERVDSGKTFESFEHMVQLCCQDQEEGVNVNPARPPRAPDGVRDKILHFLTENKKYKMFDKELEKDKDLMDWQVDLITFRAGGPDDIVPGLKKFTAVNRHFISLQEYIDALQVVLHTHSHITMVAQKCITKFLANAKCTLLPAKTPVEVQGSSLDKLYGTFGDLTTTLEVMEYMDMLNYEYDTLDDLSRALNLVGRNKQLVTKSNDEFTPYFNQPKCTLLRNPRAKAPDAKAVNKALSKFLNKATTTRTQYSSRLRIIPQDIDALSLFCHEEVMHDIEGLNTMGVIFNSFHAFLLALNAVDENPDKYLTKRHAAGAAARESYRVITYKNPWITKKEGILY
jgi:hypothetical protein